MRLAVSHTFFNKELQEFGYGHDAFIKEMMDLEQQKLKQTFPAENEETAMAKECEANDDSSSLSEASQRILRQRIGLIENNLDTDLEIDSALPALKKYIRKSSIKLMK